MSSNSDATDEELMRAYQNGSEDAFRQLFERHSGKVYGFLNKQLRDRAQVDDVFQNTFLKLHQTRSHYDPAFPFTPWLFTVCKSVMVDFIRKRSRQQTEELQVDSLSAPESTELGPMMRTDELPEQQRKVIDLRFREDLSFEEIAARLETSPTNARQIFSRAIRKLRRLSLAGGKE